MFGIAPSELMIVALAAIIFIAPKDLPRVMRLVGQWVRKGRLLTRHVHDAIDQVVGELDLEEARQKLEAERNRLARKIIEINAQIDT